MSKVVVVTGASKGVGAATAVAFAAKGYDVVVNYKSDDAAAEDVAQQIKKHGQTATLVKADVFQEEGIKQLFDQVKKLFGKIDVFVNNAGNPNEPGFGKYTFENVGASIGGNFVSVALCTQAASKIMDAGSILFTSSIYGLQFGGNPRLAIYSASKAAMINFVQTTAEILGPNIRCNAVAPGATKTPAWDGASKEYVDGALSMNIQHEWVGAEEIADAFVFLAETPHINAQTITVDAGWSKKQRVTKAAP